MNKRLVISVVLACAVSFSMTGCKGLFGGKKKDNVGDVPGVGAGDSGLGINGNGGGGRPEASGTIIDAQLAAVQFAFDSAQVDEGERAKAEAAAAYLKSNAGTTVTLEGNCDERGSTEYNMSLGERRAQSVSTYLMSLGIDANRIQTKSYGKERPKDPGHAETAWRVNRRVEFVVLKN